MHIQVFTVVTRKMARATTVKAVTSIGASVATWKAS